MTKSDSGGKSEDGDGDVGGKDFQAVFVGDSLLPDLSQRATDK